MKSLSEYRIIGLSGKIGAGKTTFSNYLQTKYEGLEPHSFAENIRQMMAIFINRPVDRLRSATDKETMTCMGKTVGVLLQELGTEVGRKVNPDAWVLSLFEYYDRETSYWIIDDVRFPNEADFIKKMGGCVIRLNGDPGNVRKNSTRDLNHISETALDDYTDFDVVIDTEKYGSSQMIDEINRVLLGRK